MLDFSALGKDPAIWMMLLFIVGQILYSQRDRLGAWLGRRGEVAAKRDDVETELLKKPLQNGERYQWLVGEFLSLTKMERHERSTMTGIAIEQARSAEKMAVQAVAVMRDSVEINQLLMARLDKLLDRIENLFQQEATTNRGLLEQIGISLTAIGFGARQGVDYTILKEAMEKSPED